jgi:hypothetical protein
MASKAHKGAVLADDFVADEILARLPAHCAARCAVLSKRFRKLLTKPHFWLRHRRLGTPLEIRHAARLYRQIAAKSTSSTSSWQDPATRFFRYEKTMNQLRWSGPWMEALSDEDIRRQQRAASSSSMDQTESSTPQDIQAL